MQHENIRAKQLREAKKELEEIDQQIRTLKARRREVCSRIERLKSVHGQHNNSHGQDFYNSDNFEWSQELVVKCAKIFHIKSFRSLQKAAINATMSGIDCLLIMPTGGGKSLCFQLPAIMKPGITVVISPLISLMEDQMMGLKDLQVETALFNAQTTREETKELMSDMINPSSNLKLIYITPEKLAKSKRFISQLEKMYSLGRFARLVIDEVHCCSQWGHDFRPDYKFLGIMKTQFQNTPILGLTATATPEVIADIQKILNIESCLILKDNFYRPNLKYEIIHSRTKDDSAKVAEIISTRFKGQSGIVYCLTVKETEDLAEKLRTNHNIRATAYHASLSPTARTKIHKNWYAGVIQVTVATIAFGMGINKMDVRFVIHYSMSKSVENYYQETGRAGRDGKPADCILFYRFQDAFRATALFFTEANSLKIIYQMITFCNERETCRKKLLAQYFGDPDCQCNNMCDNCINKLQTVNLDVTEYYRDILTILRHPQNKDERFTALKLLDVWMGKGATKLRVKNVSIPKHPREVCESIIVHLLINGYLKEEFHFTPYSTISYLIPGYKANLSNHEPITIRICTEASPSVFQKSRPRAVTKAKPKTSRKSRVKPLLDDNDDDDDDFLHSDYVNTNDNVTNVNNNDNYSEDDGDIIVESSVKKRPRILDDTLNSSFNCSIDEPMNSDNSLILLD